MAITAGPQVQMPPAVSDMFDFIYDDQGKIVKVNLRQDWAAFFSGLQQVAFAISRSGTSSSRPTSAMAGRFVGMPFYDTTLGKPIFLKTASSNAWVLADGTAA